jgi:hypothetical protein
MTPSPSSVGTGVDVLYFSLNGDCTSWGLKEVFSNSMERMRPFDSATEGGEGGEISIAVKCEKRRRPCNFFLFSSPARWSLGDPYENQGEKEEEEKGERR